MATPQPVSIMRKKESMRTRTRVHFDLPEPAVVPVRNTFVHLDEDEHDEDLSDSVGFARMQSEPVKVCRHFSLASEADAAPAADICSVSTDISEEEEEEQQPPQQPQPPQLPQPQRVAHGVKNTFVHIDVGPTLSVASDLAGPGRRCGRTRTEPVKVQMSRQLSPRSDSDSDAGDGSPALEALQFCRWLTEDGLDLAMGLEGPMEEAAPLKVSFAEEQGGEEATSSQDASPCSPGASICREPTGDFFEARLAPSGAIAGALSGTTLLPAPLPAPLLMPPGFFAPSPLPARGAIAASSGLAGHIWRKTQEAAGCRQVQQALQAANTDAEHAAIVHELRGHVREAICCPGAKHANHVIQKCITTMRANDCQFVLDEVMVAGTVAMAKQKFGCRVIQRLLEHFPAAHLRELVETLLGCAGEVCRDMYGNYVMQHLLTHGTATQVQRLMRFIEGEVRGLCSDQYGGAVVSHALHQGPRSGVLALARAILCEPGLLTLSASMQHGHVSVKRVLQVLQGQELQEARRRLGAEAAALSASNYGRIVVDSLRAEAPDCLVLPAAERADDALAAAASGQPVLGRVWQLSQDAAGCRAVQQALRDPEREDQRASILAELAGHVWDAVRCPHANHVLQECITSACRSDFQFVVDELMTGDVVQAAEHKYGCRVVQRLLEHAAPEKLQGLVEALIANGDALSQHVYGNYVMQRLFEHGTREQRARAVDVLKANLRGLGLDAHGSAVLGAALAGSAPADQERLALALLQDTGLLPQMACTRHGHAAVLRALALLPARERESAARELQAAQGLAACRYGRVTLAGLSARQ